MMHAAVAIFTLGSMISLWYCGVEVVDYVRDEAPFWWLFVFLANFIATGTGIALLGSRRR